MTLQPLQFGALTTHQQRMVDQELPHLGKTGQTLVSNRFPGSDVFYFLEDESLRILDGKPLSEDTFSPSEDFSAALGDLTDLYREAVDRDTSPLAMMRDSGDTRAFKQQGAIRLLELIRLNRTFYVPDRLIRALIAVAQD